MSISQAIIANSNTTVLTAASGALCRLLSVTFCNTSTSTAETLTVYLVPRGGSAGTSTMVIKALSVPASDGSHGSFEWEPPVPIYLDPGDAVVAIGSTGSLVNATANYVNENT